MSLKKTSGQLAELENSKAFKRSHMPFSLKWRSWLYVAPVLILFMSIFSVLYLLENDKLATWYVIPYALAFVIATIWFKAIRKHLVNKAINSPEFLLTACAKPVITDKYKVYALVSTGTNRHNSKYIEHQASTVSSAYADLIPLIKPGQILPVFPEDSDSADPLYLACLRNFSVRKNNIGWDGETPFAVILIRKRTVKSIP